MKRFLLFFPLAALVACNDVLDVGSNGQPGGDPATAPAKGGNDTTTPPVEAAQCPAAVDPGEVRVTAEAGWIDGLAADGGDLYYAVTPAGTQQSVIKRIALSGGAAVELARTAKPMSFVLSGEHIYVTPAGNGSYELLRLAKSGGDVETMPLDPGEAPVRVFPDGAGGVIYTGLRSSAAIAPLVRVASDGTRTKLAVTTPANVIADAVVATPDAIFWAPSSVTATGTADGAVYASALAGGPSTTLYGPDPGRPVYALAAADNHVYFARSGDVARAPKAGGAATTFATVDASTLVADGASLWFLGGGSYDATTNTLRHMKVGRVAKAGGAPTIVRTELTFPTRLAVARCDVVYSAMLDDKVSSEIYRRAK